MADAQTTLPITGGYFYEVSDEQLAAFGQLSLLQRLAWVEAAREFTWLGMTPETRERHQRLRAGQTITPLPEPPLVDGRLE